MITAYLNTSTTEYADDNLRTGTRVLLSLQHQTWSLLERTSYI